MLNLYDEYYNPDDDMDFTEDDDYDDAVGEEFAKDMFDFLTDIIKLSGIVSESFTSDICNKRYCSLCTNIYYDVCAYFI